MKNATITLDVSIVMPCLNEAATVAKCVAQAREALRILERKHGISGEVVVADNGSTDGSQRLAEGAGARVVSIEDRGYGAALSGGFRASYGRYLVMGDSDCSYNFIESVGMVEALMNGADFCMGSRFKGRIEPGAMPWKNRYIGNPILSGMLRLLFRTPISDSHCGLRALTRETFDNLRLSSPGMEFASEMVLKAALKKLNIAEIPVTLSPDERGRPPHLNPWRDGFRHLFYMLMLSPSWLFIVPALTLGLLGFAILSALVINGDDKMVQIGSFGIGDHWAIVASAALVLSVQFGVFGVAAHQHSIREGYRSSDHWAGRLLRHSNLHRWILLGTALIVVGFTWAATITGGWIRMDAGSLNEIRGMLAASTLIIIGSQIFFSGFLISVISGNRSKHDLQPCSALHL